MSDIVEKMVNAFLCWKLPMDFNPDGGISFDKTYSPVGTNLFTYTQAKEMVDNMIAETRTQPPAPPSGDGWRTIDSAPRDGTHILTQRERSHGNGGNTYAAVKWWKHAHEPESRFCWHLLCSGMGQTALYDYRPTHWMPLPPAPATEG